MRRNLYPLLRRTARRLGYHLVQASYYSPIPDLDQLPPDIWDRPSPMPGVDLRVDAALELLEGPLRPFLEEFAPPADPPGTARGYHYANPMYGTLDGEVLYALVRHRKPGRILEIGAGYSTLCIAEALERNEREGHAAVHVVADPYPAPALANVRDRIELRAETAESLTEADFAALGPGDVLFVDTTHTLRPGGDVVRLLLERIPSLSAGVLVHIHDIFRPFEYPRVLPEVYGVYWQEHYLVQAFLAFNDSWRVVCPNHALARLYPDRIAALLPSFSEAAAPSAFWLERVDPTA